ncbi:hypothetical protein D3C85_1155900 [compost metagenome]
MGAAHVRRIAAGTRAPATTHDRMLRGFAERLRSRVRRIQAGVVVVVCHLLGQGADLERVASVSLVVDRLGRIARVGIGVLVVATAATGAAARR